jgi:hypothetical protein
MASSQIFAAFFVPLNPEQITFALDVFDCTEDENIDFEDTRKSTAAKTFKDDVYQVAKKTVLALECYEPFTPCLDFRIDVVHDGINIIHRETVDTDTSASFVHQLLKHFNLDTYVSVQASQVSREYNLDICNNHSVFITKKGIKKTFANAWIRKQTELFNKSLLAE